MFEPSEKARQAEKILTADCFSYEKAKGTFAALSRDELTWLSECFMDHVHGLFCLDEMNSSLFPENDAHIESVAADMEERLRALLEAGLDPNHVFEDSNPIWDFQYITDEHCLNARLLRILLEHGGNPNLHFEEDSRKNSLYDYISQAIIFDEEKRKQRIPYLLMLASFGGALEDGDNCFTLLGEHAIEEIKTIEKLRWTDDCAEHVKGERQLIIHVEIHVFNRETGEEIACYT